MKKWMSLLMLVPFALTGCGTSNDTASSEGKTLTVVTERTDAEALFAQIEADFIALHPEVQDIIWETSADYSNYITTRMNTTDYGDVLLIPFSMNGDSSAYANYFEPLGTVEELSELYIDVTEADHEGIVYGLPTAINSLGIIYNTEVFKAAGITDFPTSTEELLEACEKIKQNTDAVPFFTNYNALGMWGGALTSYGGEQFKSDMLEAGTAFEEGQPIREVMDLFYELTTNGYTEQDPITGDYGKAQEMIINGEIAMVMNGSQDAAVLKRMVEDESLIEIASLPVKYKGKTSVAFGAPEVMGISKYSEDKDLAREFLEYFISAASGYADDLGGMSPVKADLTEEEQSIFNENNIVLTVATETAETEKVYTTIANEVGVARLTDVLQQVINMGLYKEQYESYESYIESLETRWAQAIKNNE